MSTKNTETPETLAGGENGSQMGDSRDNGGAIDKVSEDEGKRTRAMTEKGMEYQLQQCWKKYKTAKMSWEAEVSNLQTVINSIENIPELLKIKDSESNKFQEMKQQCDVIANLDTNAVAQLAGIMEQTNKVHCEIAQLINDRIAFLGSDSKSIQSKLSRSNCSKSRTSKSATSSAKTKLHT